ncbi:UNVERIFIED_CONTAM: hypothetical protein Sangu_2418100 [Sesamum angustifolium]|uniref:DUF7815 domain-containing protein n=1 Tax=Sesamum angustifolium TaxID=2727405 RepID=A0AAW2KVY0_9LAMI
MSRIPHELIREVQISTRAAAGLSDYNPSDPTLPALPSLSAAIAAFDPSPPHLRCENCNGRLLRGSESIICVYCGRGPHYDVVPDPISFTSTIGYQWLLRTLRLDGSVVFGVSEGFGLGYFWGKIGCLNEVRGVGAHGILVGEEAVWGVEGVMEQDCNSCEIRGWTSTQRSADNEDVGGRGVGRNAHGPSKGAKWLGLG